MINEETLAELAKTHTRPASLGPKFQMSAVTRQLREQARRDKTAAAWKHYLSTLRNEKEEWKSRRLERASQDWKTYKQLTKTKISWAEGCMAACEAEDPEGEIVKHFTEVFHDPENLQSTSELDAMARGILVDRVESLYTRLGGVQGGKTG